MIRLRVRDDRDKLRIAQAPQQSLRVSQPQPLRITQTIGPQNSRSLAMEQNRLWKSGQITPEQYKTRIGAIYSGELVQPNSSRNTLQLRGFGEQAAGTILNLGQFNPVSNVGRVGGFIDEATEGVPGVGGIGNVIGRTTAPLRRFGDTRGTIADPSNFSSRIGSEAAMFAQNVGQFANFGVTPNLATAGIFGDVGAETIRNLRSQGASQGEAVLKGSLNALIQAAVERISNRFQLNGPKVGQLNQFLAGAAMEGGEEAVQEITDNLFNNRNWYEGIPETAIRGAIYGGLLQGGIRLAGRPDAVSTQEATRNEGIRVAQRATGQSVGEQELRVTLNRLIQQESQQRENGQNRAANQTRRAIEKVYEEIQNERRNNPPGFGLSTLRVDDDGNPIRLRGDTGAKRIQGTDPTATPTAGGLRLPNNQESTLSQNQDSALDSLRQEARKYKSAEEFINSQKSVYHGTNADITEFGQLKGGRERGEFSATNSLFASENPELAGAYGKNLLEGKNTGKVLDTTTLGNKLDPNERVIPDEFADYKTNPILEPRDRRVLEESYFKSGTPSNITIDHLPNIQEYFRSKGYSAIQIPRASDVNGAATEMVIIDPTKIKTKQQLTDLYNEATGQAESTEQPRLRIANERTQSQETPQSGIKLSQAQPPTPLLESRSLKLLPPGSIQLSPAQAKQRFGAMSKRGQTFEVLNQIRSGSRPIYVTPGGRARIGKDFSVPVQQRGGEKIIRVDRNPVDVDVNPNNLRDISGFEAYMKDFNRIMEKVFTAGSSQFKQVDAEIIKPLESAKGDYIRFQQDKLNDLQKTIVVGLGIKKGSPESAAVQLYGEGKMSTEQLVANYGVQRANDIQEADQYFRSQYDELIETVNATRRKIYGNNPDKLIQKRKDYYRHFRDLNQGFSGLRNIFAQVSDIPPELAGTSEFTKPKSKFLSIAQRRLGVETDIDAVGGYLNYIPSAAYATYIDPQIDRLRKFKQDLVGELTGRRDKIQSLRDQMKQAIDKADWETYDDLKVQLESLTENGKYDDTVVNNFLGFLDDYTNDLAGKTNPADRFPQKVVGRKAFQVIDWMNKRVKANVILGNASSSIAQFFNMPQGIAQAGIKNSYKGAVRSFKTIGSPDSPMKKSNFITERYFDSYNQFDTKLFDKSRNFAAWMVQVGDEVGTKFIWNSMYEQALEQNMNEAQAVRFADNQTRKMVAGRGVGEVPLLQKSRVFQMAAPFQLEVQNLWYVLGDQVSKKEFGKLVTFAVSVHLMNSAAEAIRGSDVAFDPIEALLEAFDAFDDEEDKKVGALLAAGRLGGEVLSNVPLGQQLASIYPEYGVDIGDETVTREELFGDADPTRFGTGFGGGTLIGRGIQDPLFRLIPPFGGQQIKRTLDATQTLNRGYSETPSGRVRFPVDDGVRNRLQGTVFGQYALPEAQQYFDSGNSALGENQSEEFRNQPRDQRQQFYNDIMLNRERNRTETDEEKKARKEATKQIEQERTTYAANQDSPSLFNKYGLPPVPLNDDVANAYSRLQEKINDGEVTDVSLPSAERKIVKDAYLSQLEPTVREFWNLGDDDMRTAIQNGLITKQDMDDVIALDDALFRAGILKYPQVGKTLRGELGYGLADGTQAKSSSRSGRSIKISSLAPKGSVTTANDIRIAFDKVTPKSTRTSVPGDPSRIIRIARG